MIEDIRGFILYYQYRRALNYAPIESARWTWREIQLDRALWSERGQ